MNRVWMLVVILVGLGYVLVTHPVLQTVTAGVAIFLVGMLFMEQGFRSLTGGVLEKTLAHSTNSLPKSQFFGLVTTAIMQSSSLVTVMTIATVSAGLISLTSGAGIIFGANIGTTTGAWLMAAFGMKVDIARFAMPLLVLGLVLTFQKRKSEKGFGRILTGIGFVFLGIAYMKDGFSVFSESFDLSQYAVPGTAGLLLFTGIGMLATVVMQSSHATLMLSIAALATGQVTYENGLGLAIGSNIGTTVTALLSAVNANIEGRRLVCVHVIFNLVTAVLAIVFIDTFVRGVDSISAACRIAEDNWTMKLAVFHTAFNVFGVMVMTPLLKPLVWILEKTFRAKPVKKERGFILEPLYLNEAAIGVPDAAIEVLLKETSHLFENVFEVLAHGINLHRSDILSDEELNQIVSCSTEVMAIDVLKRYYGGIKILYNAIIDFSVRVAEGEMTSEQITRINSMRMACRHAAEIIKVLSNLRPNLNEFMNSENTDIREQYNLIRQNVAGALRQIYGVKDSRNYEEVQTVLMALEREGDANDVLLNGQLDALVREQRISSQMATSLMNDSAASSQMIKILIEISGRMAVAWGVRPDTLQSSD